MKFKATDDMCDGGIYQSSKESNTMIELLSSPKSTVGCMVTGLIVFYILSQFTGALFIVCTLLLGIVLFCLSKITGQSGSTRRETDREFEKVITRLRKENDKYRQERDNTLQRLSPMTSLKHEKENLQSQIERQTRTTDNLLDEIAQLKIEQKIHQREKLQYADELYAEKDNSRRKCLQIERKWQESIDRSNKDIENVKTALFQQELESQMYRDQCTGLTERLKTAMTEGHSIETQLQTARIEIQKERGALEAYKKSSKETFDSMETEINKNKELMKKYGEFVNKHKDSDRILQTSFAELEKIKNENNSLKLENSNLNKRVIDLGKESEVPQCSICMERERNAYMDPCGHTLCMVCATEVMCRNRKCPVCRKYISKTGELYFN
ncbi:probable E3 ubiquitin-protein ligase bre1 [Mytilus californianus]|uniref:probable E3 ubiquitin-protein ligase bre1 n=1 Tax=Mytilus californianus TaxID=6549 RepID=UPI0022464D59|nr:probable E3 ubiquitin-protein ligase bre1 [Mytilus californianus]